MDEREADAALDVLASGGVTIETLRGMGCHCGKHTCLVNLDIGVDAISCPECGDGVTISTDVIVTRGLPPENRLYVNVIVSIIHDCTDESLSVCVGSVATKAVADAIYPGRNVPLAKAIVITQLAQAGWTTKRGET